MPLFIPLRPLVLCLIPFGAVDYPESPTLFSDPFLNLDMMEYEECWRSAAVSCNKKNLLFLRLMNMNSSGSEAK